MGQPDRCPSPGDRAQRVGHVGDGDQPRLRTQQLLVFVHRSVPLSSIGTTFSLMPFSVSQHLPRHDIGVMFHLRNDDLVALARFAGPSAATRLIASVALRVKMISPGSRALMKRAPSRAPLRSRVVAVALSQCRPRWTLEYSSA